MRKHNNALLIQAMAHEPALRAILYRLTRNMADVEELLQDTYIQLLLSTAEVITNAKAYAARVAHGRAVDHLRHQVVVPIVLMDDLEELNELDQALLADEQRQLEQELAFLSRCVAQLPPGQRRVFVLLKVYGFSQREIAARLGITENTVEQHMYKASRNLAKIVEELSS